MFKDVLNHMAGATDFASIGLVIFFCVFILITLRTLLRTKTEVGQWSQLPLSDEATPAMETRHE